MNEFYELLKNSEHYEEFENFVNPNKELNDKEKLERSEKIFKMGLMDFYIHKTEKSYLMFKGEKLRLDRVRNIGHILWELKNKSDNRKIIPNNQTFLINQIIPKYPIVRGTHISDAIKKVIKSTDKFNRTSDIYLKIIKQYYKNTEFGFIDLTELVNKIPRNMILPKMEIGK